jgi:DHA2 family multidrug resistance protein
MEVLDTSIANVSLRNIAGSLAASLDESTWVLTSYLVASAVVLPVSGWLANMVGRKRFNLLCIATFTAASVLCALAPNLQWLIAFRIIQGLGGGGLAPVEQSMLADTFPARQRGQAFALYGFAVVVAPTIGPTLGGWLTDNLTWHWIFLINGPVGVIALILVQWLVHEPEILERERRARLARGVKVDWIGFLLVAACLGSLEIVFDKGVEDDWFASRFIETFATISLVSFLLLVPWELTRSDPVVDLRLFKRRQFATCVGLMFAVGAILFSSTQLLPQLVQTNFQYTATLSGLALMPGGIAMALMMPVVGVLSGQVAPKYLMGCGLTLVALSMWHLTSLSPDANFGFFAWARIYQTVGLPLLFIPILSASYAGLPQSQTDQASALMNVARNIGGSTGISLANTVLTNGEQINQNHLTDHLVPSSPAYQRWCRMRLRISLVASGCAAAGLRVDRADRAATGGVPVLYQRLRAIRDHRGGAGPSPVRVAAIATATGGRPAVRRVVGRPTSLRRFSRQNRRRSAVEARLRARVTAAVVAEVRTGHGVVGLEAHLAIADVRTVQGVVVIFVIRGLVVGRYIIIVVVPPRCGQRGADQRARRKAKAESVVPIPVASPFAFTPATAEAAGGNRAPGGPAAHRCAANRVVEAADAADSGVANAEPAPEPAMHRTASDATGAQWRRAGR